MSCMDELKQVGVIGEGDAVLAFRALGMRVIAAHELQEIEHAIQKLVREGVPVIFITERAMALAQNLVQHYQGDVKVAIIPIPGSSGTDGTGMKHVRANVEKAIGADILFQNNKEEK